ncbi:MAG: histidinol dehydrogenase [Chitinophagaceae bacterium]|nr:MAG: histidinol dehydrogenase [Chitinophagaceae bacterium]
MDNIFLEPAITEWENILQRPALGMESLENIVQPILDDVKLNGDEAVKRYSSTFDKVQLETLLVSQAEMEEGVSQVAPPLKAAIAFAQRNISRFHEQQKETLVKIETTEGVLCWRKSIAIQNVGLYIPGGTAPLFSTLLMLAIPAQIAGCKNVVVCTPAGADGKIHPAILYTAQLLGLKNIYKIGGVQAIAAMAYGTDTVKKVDKIFGPGNQYVTCAKQLVNKSGIAIDMPAGPSEVAVYADESAVTDFVAADLLSQAEHGTDSQVILVASSEKIAEAVQEAVNSQLQQLPRKEIAVEALKHSRFIVLQEPATAFNLLNTYAPEHLIIASNSALQLSAGVVNAGSVFLGNYSPEAAGDYASGTNHTLPTNGYARAYSGVSIDSFVKKITFQQLNKTGLNNIGPAVRIMAEAEGLQGHANAITIRLNSLS